MTNEAQTVETRTAHTPGPWRLGRTSNPDYDTAVLADDCRGVPFAVGLFYPPLNADVRRMEVAQANARLAAAAPALLEALEAVDRWHRGYGTKTQAEIMREVVEPAIRAARGEA